MAATTLQRLPKAYESLPPKVQEALRPLSVQHRKIVEAYVGPARGNARLACELAGIQRSNPNAFYILAHRILNKPEVKAAVQAWLEAYSMPATEVTARITDYAHINAAVFYEVDPTSGKLKLKDKFDPVTWQACAHWVKAIKTDEKGNVIDLQLHSSFDALKELARIHKLIGPEQQALLAVHVHLSKLSDAEILELYFKAREKAMGEGGGMRALAAGAEVQSG